MAGRFPFNNGQRQQQLNPAHVRAALGMDEAIYLRQQHDLQRQLQKKIDSMLHEQNLRAIGEHLQEFPDLQRYQNILFNEQLQREQVHAHLRYQEEWRRRQLANQQETALSAQIPPNVAHIRDIAADSLAGNAVKKTELDRKRSAGSAVCNNEVSEPPMKKPAPQVDKKPKAKQRPCTCAPTAKMKDTTEATPVSALDSKEDSHEIIPVGESEKPVETTGPVEPPKAILCGTMEDLVAAAEADTKTDQAASTLKSFKEVVWSESEKENEDGDETPKITVKKGESINLPDGFTSVLPQLPIEPSWCEPDNGESLVQPAVSVGLADSQKKQETDVVGAEASKDKKAKGRTVSNILDYPYPIDVWWPSTTGIRRERRGNGESSDEDDFQEEPTLTSEASPFRANLPKIRSRLGNDSKPGVLEKLPHCKLHRLLMKQRKNLSAPELVYCWQVTELYPNEIMVCCTECGTWRHAACGGHYEEFSVRKCLDQPFNPVCCLCQEEKKILDDFPRAKQRLERQRLEQLRRGLSSSAVMRQASFAKHGGTYKWPLGRVSATHIGGHTRSVHSRHDKAEKQWGEMATKLGRGYGYRPKERVRVRTKELERLLVSVEDAEAQTDRHNMLLFLLRDTLKKFPVGFEHVRRNIFDPEEDDVGAVMDEEDEDQSDAGVEETEGSEGGRLNVESIEGQEKKKSLCARNGCRNRRRFDSLLCSDSCGVSVLESDLLRTFWESSDIHPSVLRN